MIHYVRGDATSPLGAGPRLIIHIVNDAGGWGRGFVLAVSKRWKRPEECYREWAREEDFGLGHVQFVEAEAGSDLWVANMVAQHGYGRSKTPRIRYDALAECLGEVGQAARDMKASVHLPRIGTGLAGGSWEAIEPLIQKALEGVEVYVYDL